MKCPNCDAPIPDALIARSFASKGGKASHRSLDSDTARQMVEAREVKKVVRKLEAGGFEYVQGPRGALAIKAVPELARTIWPIVSRLESYREEDGSIWHRLKRTGGTPEKSEVGDDKRVERAIVQLSEAKVHFWVGPLGGLTVQATVQAHQILLPIIESFEKFYNPDDGDAIWFRLKKT